MNHWNKSKCVKGSDENVVKFVFENEKPKAAVCEAVLYKYPTYKERTVICCSTMAGCPMGCSFCGTGKFFIRSLTSDEIVAQVKHCMDYTLEHEDYNLDDMEKCQIMFMSMGEPLLNWKQLKQAIIKLNKLYPWAALLISTSGPDVPHVYQDLCELSSEIDKIGLQFSVHESTDEARNKLIPFKKKLDLESISEWGSKWADYAKRKPYFNYCVHNGNNTDQDADNILNLFPPSIFEATLSVICESDESVASSIARQEKLATDFSNKLLEREFNTRVFNPAGQDDIGGGCGQLWYVQDWAKKNPSLIHDSAGS